MKCAIEDCEEDRQTWSPNVTARNNRLGLGNGKLCIKHNLRKRKYGFASDDDMIAFCLGPCRCCGIKKKNMVVDHSYTTGKPRGWLCHGCNTLVGTIERGHIRKGSMVPLALKYIEEYGS